MIRALKENDINDCIKMININFNEIYDQNCKEDLINAINDKNQIYKVIEHEGKCIGMAAYKSSYFTYNYYELYCVNIHPDYHGKGFGRFLINHIIKEIKNYEIDRDIYIMKLIKNVLY